MLFNDENSDSDTELKVNNGYANNYNSWRQKEELYKLKTKYGEHIKDLGRLEEDSESSSDEDEQGAELTDQLEKDFYKTLACLKNKDPKIYDEKVEFFEATDVQPTSKKVPKEKKLFLRDYERKIIVERDGKYSDSEDDEKSHFEKTGAPTYVEEQLALRESISKAVSAVNDEDESDDEDSGLLKPKAKTEAEKFKEEESYRDWLKGQKAEIENEDEKTLKPLRDYWTDPNLDSGEKFLRDYVLNKKFRDNDDGSGQDYEHFVHDSDDNLSADERNIEQQEEFEHKYNFRFEEPDQEFIKRYPRTLENSLRKKDTRRSQKRAEVKQRKEDEKVRKMEELKQLKALKRKEIADKIAQLKEITGNDDMQFGDIDLEADFDPAEHDRKMQELFNEEYYAAAEENEKPEFPDLDEELGIEPTWDDYDPENEEIVPADKNTPTGSRHCEDPDFNMDADYDPVKSLQDELLAGSKKKKRRRQSKFAEIIAKEKPKFDPAQHSSFRDYIEQYYALDYEDMIDDMPCRFKYRKVVPNDYGLTVEEILNADDRELNKWCSLKKALEHKPENMEMNEVRSYQQKAKNEAYKKKVLKSLYTPEEEVQDPETAINVPNVEPETTKNKRKKKKKKSNTQTVNKVSGTEKSGIAIDEEIQGAESIATSTDKMSQHQLTEKSGKKKKKNQEKREFVLPEKLDEAQAQDMPKSPVKKAEKRQLVNNDVQLEIEEPRLKKHKIEDAKETTGFKTTKNDENTDKISKKKKKRKNQSSSEGQSENNKNLTNPETNLKKEKRTNKKKQNKTSNAPIGKSSKKRETDQMALLSSERLKAYGINPKKFKNKLKYGKQT